MADEPNPFDPRITLKPTKMREVEDEFGEPIIDILRGFAAMGYSSKTTAKIIGVNPDTIRSWLVRYGVPSPFQHPNNNRTRSPFADCRVNGMTIHELAAHYSVSLPTISRWIKEGKLQCDHSTKS